MLTSGLFRFASVLLLTSLASYALGRWLYSPHIDTDDLSLIRRRAPVVRSVQEESQMVHRVNQLWSRIEIQLQQISPADFNLLAAGCQEQDLEQLQNRLGLSLPIEVRASLLRHNGDLDNSPQLNDVGGMFRLFSDKQVLTEYRAKVEKWSWSGQQKWIEHSNNWPTMIALASSIDFNFNIDCLSGKVYLGRSGYNNADFIASDWSVVLEAWAVALEQKKYTVGVQGISVDNWAGLNPY